MITLKFDDVRVANLDVAPAVDILDGTIGVIYKVSCGTFDKDNKFDTTYT